MPCESASGPGSAIRAEKPAQPPAGPEEIPRCLDTPPGWTILVAILVFPFGLLALTHKARESQVFVNAIAAGEGRTLVDVVGVAPAGVRRALLELER